MTRIYKDIYVCDIVGEVVWRQEYIRIFMDVILLGKLFGDKNPSGYLCM